MTVQYTDRELLELAAKAAGIQGEYVEETRMIREFCAVKYIYIKTKIGFWNPLTNDGDAFALMVKLDIMVYRHPKLGGYLIEASYFSDDYQNVLVRQEYKKDEVEEAFRLAIVKCAALVGEKMK